MINKLRISYHSNALVRYPYVCTGTKEAKLGLVEDAM
jgi:hypothetical protein